MLPPPSRARRARRRHLPLLPPAVRRRPAVWWLATALLAGATAQVVSGALTRAEDAAARFGRLGPVLVATRDVEPGALLGPDVADVRELPAALVPPGAAGADALGRRVGRAIVAGEVVHTSRLVPAGLSALAAALPPGTRGIAVPAGPGALPLRPGDVVDVLVTTGDHEVVPPTATVSAGSTVVDVGEAAVTVAVRREDAARVAYAVATGLVTLVLTGR